MEYRIIHIDAAPFKTTSSYGKWFVEMEIQCGNFPPTVSRLHFFRKKEALEYIASKPKTYTI